ncbi:hypothetical protein SCP_0903580 [Sparassis crispa]|uniref:Uncharacterized protein n=1 Tax=Sparassis crispa TaxID=139825 RepID=A0A401GWD5_9APHY|nr:hypothetical protein SCP_0903580 [Sparassis crispa]GBE86479.1 hypothetical protein SCP_0903580 [Sparassis crispa]
MESQEDSLLCIWVVPCLATTKKRQHGRTSQQPMPPALLKELFREAVTESEGDQLIHILKGKKFKGGLLQLELTLDWVTFDFHATQNDIFVFNAAKFIPKTAIVKLILFCGDFEPAAGTHVIIIQGEQCGLIGVVH